MTRIDIAVNEWLLHGGKSPLALWPSFANRIPVVDRSYTTVMDENGEFHCPHEYVEIEYDAGGDGRTEPGSCYSVYCPDCGNDDLTDKQVRQLIENHIEAQECWYE